MATAIILAAILAALEYILFALEGLMGKVLDLLYSMFRVFAGIETVRYKGERTFLLDVFFSNGIVSKLFWGMACIGFAMAIGFCIFSVIRKQFDSTGEKVKATYGMILTNLFKSILIIMLLTAIVSATITATGTLMTSIDDLFNRAEESENPSQIAFDGEDFATMFRVLDTIGNYSLNPSYNNRFNINNCYNAILKDMRSLNASGVFKFDYEEAPESWQYYLKQIEVAGNINEEIPVDTYNEDISNAILACMTAMKTNPDFAPLKDYKVNDVYNNGNLTLGRTIMVACSFNAAKNGIYNKYASLTDALRKPFYTGVKDIYNRDEVTDYFSIGLTDWNHLVAIVAMFLLIKQFLAILINCIARIFNMILLYVTGPLFISVMPLDDGGKTKQWTTSFVIQSCSIFGSFIAVRLVVVFIPIILSNQLVLFENVITNMIAKIVMVVAVCITAERANGLIGGILADNAGYQSILAGDVGGGLVQRGMALGTRAVTSAGRLGLSAASGVLGGLGTFVGATTVKDAVAKDFKNMGQSMRENGGFLGARNAGWTTEASRKEAAEKAAAAMMNPVNHIASGVSSNQPVSNQSFSMGGNMPRPRAKTAPPKRKG